VHKQIHEQPCKEDVHYDSPFQGVKRLQKKDKKPEGLESIDERRLAYQRVAREYVRVPQRKKITILKNRLLKQHSPRIIISNDISKSMSVRAKPPAAEKNKRQDKKRKDVRNIRKRLPCQTSQPHFTPTPRQLLLYLDETTTLFSPPESNHSLSSALLI